MSKFLIETSSVEAVADSLKDLFKSAKDTVRSVNRYDTSNDDGFDFASAKKAIETNIDAAYIKINLTSQYLTNVVNTHKELQESVSKNGSVDPTSATSTTTTTTTSNNNGTYNGYSNYSGYNGSTSSSSTPGTEVTNPEASADSQNEYNIESVSISPTILSELIKAGILTEDTIKKLNDTEEIVMVLNIGKDDRNKEKYVELAAMVAKEYNIQFIVNELDDDKKTILSSVSLIKNGITLAKTYKIDKEDAIRELFDKVGLFHEVDDSVEVPSPDVSSPEVTPDTGSSESSSPATGPNGELIDPKTGEIVYVSEPPSDFVEGGQDSIQEPITGDEQGAESVVVSDNGIGFGS